MIESYENILQIAVLIICALIALYRAVAGKSRAWTLAFFFYGSWVFGDIYWLICLIFFGDTPKISVVSDLSWYASYIFLYMLLRPVSPPEEHAPRRLMPWLGPVFAAAMAVFFMLRGEILSNLIYGSLMGLLLFSAITRLLDAERYQGQRFLAAMVLVFCLLEYGLWLASCFWTAESLFNPYYWFDILLTVSFLFFIPAVKRAVAE